MSTKSAFAVSLVGFCLFHPGLQAATALTARVQVQETVYTFTAANNGAGPMWCSGSTSLVRVGDRVFASGIETIAGAKPLNNCRWNLYERTTNGWVLRYADPSGRTREPSPLVVFADGSLFLSANPTLSKAESGGGPARPEVLRFSADDVSAGFTTLLPAWQGQPPFTEHSYRSFAADGPARELILFQNIDYTHAEWSFLDKSGKWSAQGRLDWPKDPQSHKPGPIRVCYPNVAVKNRAVYFCGVSDIIEPNPEWRAFKKQLTGQEWDYDFRRLFFTFTPDITRSNFAPWLEVASREQTCGWISPGDLWVDPEGTVHLVWTERAIDERLRAKFFPNEKQRHSMNYAMIREGRVVGRQTLLAAEEGTTFEVPSAPRFQVTPDNRLLLIFYVSGTSAAGKRVSENRLMELKPGSGPGPMQVIAFEKPFTSWFTATPRGGSAPSYTLDVLGHREGEPTTLSYARIELSP